MRIGAHQSVAGGVSKAFARAEIDGAQAIQIFTRSARGWSAPPLASGEVSAFRAEAKRSSLPAFAHGSYLTNLASEDAVIRQKSLTSLRDELQRSAALGLSDLVIHPGANPDQKNGVALISQALNEVLAELPPSEVRLTLEITAGQGNSIGHTLGQLAAILDGVQEKQRIGICLDTCHLHAAGYDLTQGEGYQRFMDELDELLGIERVTCFHLNDCKGKLGCRVDRHEEIGQGSIGLPAFQRLMQDERFSDTPGVLETPSPERYAHAIGLLQSLKHG